MKFIAILVICAVAVAAFDFPGLDKEQVRAAVHKSHKEGKLLGLKQAGMGMGMGGAAPPSASPSPSPPSVYCPAGKQPNAIIDDFSGEFLPPGVQDNSISFYSCEKDPKFLGSVPPGVLQQPLCLPDNQKYYVVVGGGSNLPFVGVQIFNVHGPKNWSVVALSATPYTVASDACTKCPRGQDDYIIGVAFAAGSINSFGLKDCAGKDVAPPYSVAQYHQFDQWGIPVYVDATPGCFPKKFIGSSDTGADFGLTLWDFNAKEVLNTGSNLGLVNTCQAPSASSSPAPPAPSASVEPPPPPPSASVEPQ